MIRDPSDGSKREAKEINPGANEINSIAAKRRSKEITSGLPPITKDQANEADRLKRSREWLKDYHTKQQAQP
jgi:hypothetical protein